MKKMQVLLLSIIVNMVVHCADQEPVTRAAQWNAFSSDVFSYTITPTDLTCYPFVITKAGNYIVTRDFIHVAKAAQDGQPLIQVLADNVVIHFQSFTIQQKKSQVDGTESLVVSNLIEIGDDTTSVCNVSIVNGALIHAGGFGIRVFPNSSNIHFDHMKIIGSAAGGIALATNQDIEISNCEVKKAGRVDAAGDVSDLFFPDDTYDSLVDDELGGFGLLGLDVQHLIINNSSFSDNGSLTRDKNIYGILLQDCSDVTLDNCQCSLNKSNKYSFGALMSGTCSFYIKNSQFVLNNATENAAGLKMKSVMQGEIDNCEFSTNFAAGAVGLELLLCKRIECNNLSIDNNYSTGPLFGNAVVSGSSIPFYGYDSSAETWSASLGNANIQSAYADYKTYIAISEEDKTFVDWESLMKAQHAIDYVLDYYTYQSKAYGVKVTDSSYITFNDLDVVGTYAENNSAFGIFIDKGTDNILQNSNIQGTTSFAATADPNVTYATDIETLFGDILDEGSGQAVRSGETISMLGRSIGLEIRNNAESMYIYKNQFKNNSSSHSFAAGLFFNRSLKATAMENRYESNCGSDFGYGVINRVVDPTDVVSGSVFYANGTLSNKNLNYGMHWSISGKFSTKHVYPGDLDLANNVGPYENLEILFDSITIPSLSYTIPATDVDADYIA